MEAAGQAKGPEGRMDGALAAKPSSSDKNNIGSVWHGTVTSAWAASVLVRGEDEEWLVTFGRAGRRCAATFHGKLAVNFTIQRLQNQWEQLRGALLPEERAQLRAD